MKVYLSGPMSGQVDYNKPAFFRAAAELRCMNHEVINPAETDKDAEGIAWESFLRKDLASIVHCDAIALLPGWDKSKGARFELFVCYVLGMHIIYAADGKAVERSVIIKSLLYWITKELFKDADSQ